MKWIFAFSIACCFMIISAPGQEVPPAFERSGVDAPSSEPELDLFDPATNAPKLIRVQLEYVELSHKDLTRLLMEDKGTTADAKALRMKLQEMAEKDQAKVLDTQIVIGRSGQKSKSGSQSEFIYPIEYGPPDPGPATKDATTKNPPAQSAPIPTSFETRLLGSNLESEPTTGVDDQMIDLRFVSELSWHVGNTTWNDEKNAAANPLKVTTPEFYRIDINTSITCLAGQYVLLGAVSPKSKEGRMDFDRKVMVFVKCDILPVVP